MENVEKAVRLWISLGDSYLLFLAVPLPIKGVIGNGTFYGTRIMVIE